MIIYTDSSFNDKHKVAGIGCVIICGQQRRIFSKWIKTENNNIGELYAIYYALELIREYPGPHTLYTDSQNAIAYISDNVKDRPLTPKQQKNRLECRKWAYRINQIAPQDLKIEKVKAHTGHYQFKAINNAMADLLAKEGIVKFLNSIKQMPRKLSRER